MLDSIETSRETTLARLIYALGIENVGAATAKLICKQFDEDPQRTADATREELSEIGGIGDVIAGSFTDYFQDQDRRAGYEKLLKRSEAYKGGDEGSTDFHRDTDLSSRDQFIF